MVSEGLSMAIATISDRTEYLAGAHAMTANFGPKGVSVSKIEDYANLRYKALYL
jgi:hypothetical protein